MTDMSKHFNNPRVWPDDPRVVEVECPECDGGGTYCSNMCCHFEYCNGDGAYACIVCSQCKGTGRIEVDPDSVSDKYEPEVD